ncbi:MAG: DJ-1/PfpI family protein [Vampirovibrionales bacterium]|nr:DJ-1/PfpI family protein [Vampirovibrionales bacterium]
MKKILMLIAPQQFRDEELLVPRKALTAAGYTVDTASTKPGDATGMLGAKEPIALTFDDVEATDYAAIIVVGGMGAPEFLWQNARVHQLLKQAAAAERITAGICLSGALPALAGVAQGKRCTVYETPESLEALKQGGTQYTAEPVTADGDVITANGPDAATAFAEAILARLQQKASLINA